MTHFNLLASYSAAWISKGKIVQGRCPKSRFSSTWTCFRFL